MIVPAEFPWASPLVPVAKKDSSTRWAVNYKELKKFNIPDALPIPNISHLIGGLAGSEIFSYLDAAQAFHNVQISDDKQQLTTFIYMFGLFQFKCMPFGQLEQCIDN